VRTEEEIKSKVLEKIKTAKKIEIKWTNYTDDPTYVIDEKLEINIPLGRVCYGYGSVCNSWPELKGILEQKNRDLENERRLKATNLAIKELFKDEEKEQSL
jgi:hypothetical protein